MAMTWFTASSKTRETLFGCTVINAKLPRLEGMLKLAESSSDGSKWCASSITIQCGRPVRARNSCSRGSSPTK